MEVEMYMRKIKVRLSSFKRSTVSSKNFFAEQKINLSESSILVLRVRIGINFLSKDANLEKDESNQLKS